MKIATWNIERPALKRNRLPAIAEHVKGSNAEIVVLTETLSELDLGSDYHTFETSPTAVGRQIEDFLRIGKELPLCIVGDLNTSFSDNFYFTHESRNRLRACFEELKLQIATQAIPNNIDHIVISASMGLKTENTYLWNQDLKLSDHIGIALGFTSQK